MPPTLVMQVQKNIAWLYWNGMIRTLRPIPVNKIKLVIFDLDGTLIDSKLDLAAAVNAMLRNYGRNRRERYQAEVKQLRLTVGWVASHLD